VVSANTPQTMQFVINAPQLAPALIQFSHQSGLAIVFSSRITRNLAAPPLTGTMSSDEALNHLLSDTKLTWKLVGSRVVAIYEARCEEPTQSSAQCPNSELTLSKYPVYIPGLEETWIYGSHTTGSRIRHASHNGTAPVDIISSPDIELSGAQTLGELLKFVPAVAGNSASTAISNGGDGTATVTLRGLPSSNTLVLINGRRVANDGLAGESVDLNSIPPAAVERIEILKDGASAIYGSDAIAGVVNVIMRKDFHGFLVETFYGKAEQGDLLTQTQTLQYGTGIPNGSFFISGSFYDQKPIYSRDREISSSADTRPLGGTDQRSSATPAARITLANGNTVILDEGRYRAATDDDLFNYQAFTSAVVPLERGSIYSNVSYDLNEKITAMLEVSYLKTSAEAKLAPTPVFTAFEQTPLNVSASNAFNPFGQDIEDVRRRLVEFPARRQQNEAKTSRVSATLEGLYDDWNWDINFGWSENRASEASRNIVNADRLQRGLGPGENCQGAAVDGCVAINLLGEPGSISDEQINYIVTSGKVRGSSELTTISMSFSKQALKLPYGSTDLAMGVEHRRESTDKRPDALLASTGTIGATNFEATSGARRVTELYAELAFPIWRSTSGLSSLDIDTAVRFSNYTDFGDATNPKLGIRFQINPAILLRATYADGFRAPSLNELYEGNTEEQAFINDPCTSPANVDVLPGCTALADSTRNQFLTVKGGNPKLKAETSDSYGAGIVWMPQTNPGIVLSADYFQIEQDDVIDSSAQFVVNQNALWGRFEESVERDAQGNLQLISANKINVGQRKVRGVDFALTYHVPRKSWGQFSMLAGATYIDEFLTRLDTSAPLLDLAGTFRDEASEGLGGIPQWKGQLNLRWSGERWRTNYQIHFVGKMEEVIPDSTQTRDIRSWIVHDLQFGYKFNVLDGLRWTMGVDNLLDESAPLATSAFNDNIDGRTHELKGRFWYTKLSQRF
jgi:iron complex outermembrane receptor protein